MKDDNLRRDEKKRVAKNETQGKDIDDTEWKTCIRRIRNMGKLSEKFLEQQKST